MRSSFAVLPFLQALLLLGSSASVASAAELLQLVLVGTSTNSSIAAMNRAKGDATAILNRFAGREGIHYTPLAPGQFPPSGRMLRGSGEGNQQDEVEGDEAQSHRKLPFGGCPDGCSNSGSPSCVQIGCAYCGRCGRRRELQPVGRQRVVEADLTIDVQGYCMGAPDCTIMFRVFKVNEDGTTERAT
jgi:hypothetical protein